MKRILAMLLIGALILTVPAGLAGENDNRITVATTTAIRGTFFADLFGGTTADLDVKALIAGAETVTLTASAVDSYMYQVNDNAIAQATTQKSGEGTVYTFTLKEGLAWSDGSAMTAQDYVFSVLMQSAPEMKALGADVSAYDRIVGWAEYAGGQSKTFSGVHLLDDKRFSMTIAAGYLPDFFELADVSVFPCPIAACAPGCTVTDDGSGAEITGGWTAEGVLRYASHPSPVSGAYRLDAFDAEKMVADFSINPNYCGIAPGIEKIRFMTVRNADIYGLMKDGTVDVFVNATDVEAIHQLDTLQLNRVEYDRRGLAFLALNCESGPFTDVNVRKAIACCVDRDRIIRDFLGGRGSRVLGWYGQGMWMLKNSAVAMRGVVTYDENLTRAASFLANSRFVLDGNGDPYTGSGVRYAAGENGLEKLTLTYFRTKDNRCAEMIGDMLTQNGEKLGIEIVTRDADMTTESLQYYRAEERAYDLMFIATNFRMVYDPADEFSVSDEAQGYLNKSGLRDEKLYQLALDMRATPAGSRAAYLAKFIDFQAYFSRVLPSVPLYSNRYLACWNGRIDRFHPENRDSWGQAILTAVYTGN